MHITNCLLNISNVCVKISYKFNLPFILDMVGIWGRMRLYYLCLAPIPELAINRSRITIKKTAELKSRTIRFYNLNVPIAC